MVCCNLARYFDFEYVRSCVSGRVWGVGGKGKVVTSFALRGGEAGEVAGGWFICLMALV